MNDLTNEQLYYLFEGGIKPAMVNEPDWDYLHHLPKYAYTFKFIDGEVRFWNNIPKFDYDYLYNMADEIRTIDNHRQILMHGDSYTIVMC